MTQTESLIHNHTFGVNPYQDQLIEAVRTAHTSIQEIQDQRTQELRAYELTVSNLRAKVEELEANLVAEAVRTASEKLRADQMSQQHSTQASLNSEARKDLAEIKLSALAHPAEGVRE